MRNIKRLGAPTPVIYKFEVRLSAAPTRDWLRCFRQAAPTTGTFRPSQVTFRGDTLAFVSADPDPTAWVRHLDAWIAAANRKAPSEPPPGGATAEQAGIGAVTRKLDQLLKE